MWTRGELKEAAKQDLSRSYWGAVLMALIMGIVKGGGSGGSGGSSNSSSKSIQEAASSMDAQAIMAVVLVVLAVVLAALVIGLALSIFVFNPLSVGGYRYFVEATYEAKTVSDMKCLGMGFSNGNYKSVVKTLFFKGLYQWLWSLLFIIPGIVKGYEYRMIPYILAENPQITTEEAFLLSKEMMTGEKWNAFVLDLSFLGWIILSIFTCGILAVFYVNPYVFLTDAHLYETLKRKSSVDYFDPSLGGGYDNYAQQGSISYGEASPYDTYQDATDVTNASDNDMFGGPIE